jgi:hypothetical protein
MERSVAGSISCAIPAHVSSKRSRNPVEISIGSSSTTRY